VAQTGLLDLKDISSELRKSRNIATVIWRFIGEDRTGRRGHTDLIEIIEEAPAPGLSAELKKDLAEKAVAAAKAVD